MLLGLDLRVVCVVLGGYMVIVWGFNFLFVVVFWYNLYLVIMVIMDYM